MLKWLSQDTANHENQAAFLAGEDIGVIGGLETKPDRGKQLPSSDARAAIEVKQAAAELTEFGHAIRSLGLASWAFGVGFAAAAMGLRFLNGADMAAPEFISCFFFASLLVIFGVVVALWVHRQSQIAGALLHGWPGCRIGDLSMLAIQDGRVFLPPGNCSDSGAVSGWLLWARPTAGGSKGEWLRA